MQLVTLSALKRRDPVGIGILQGRVEKSVDLSEALYADQEFSPAQRSSAQTTDRGKAITIDGLESVLAEEPTPQEELMYPNHHEEIRDSLLGNLNDISVFKRIVAVGLYEFVETVVRSLRCEDSTSKLFGRVHDAGFTVGFVAGCQSDLRQLCLAHIAPKVNPRELDRVNDLVVATTQDDPVLVVLILVHGLITPE